MKITLKTIGYPKILLALSIAGVLSAAALEIGYSVVNTNCNVSSITPSDWYCQISVVGGFRYAEGILYLSTSTGSCNDQSCTNANPQVLFCGNPTPDPNQPCTYTSQSWYCNELAPQMYTFTNQNGYCSTVSAHN